MKLTYISSSILSNYAHFEFETIPENDKGQVTKFRIEVEFNETSGEYPSGGHGDNISYTPCKMAEDANVTLIEITEGDLKGFNLDDNELIQAFVGKIESLDGHEFYERVVEMIEEEL